MSSQIPIEDLKSSPEAYEEVSANNWLKLKNFLDAYHAKRVAFYEFASTYYGNDKEADVKSQLKSSSGKSMVKYIPMIAFMSQKST